jgi:cellulose synthase operon protein C
LNCHLPSKQHSRKPLGLFVALLCVSVASPLLAREHLLGVLDNPALLQCETAWWSGQHSEANSCYRNLLSSGEPALIQAEAMWALGDLQGANRLFQQAQNNEPDNALVRVRWGELYMQTYQYQEAYNLFNEALGIDNNLAWAHLGAARALQNGGDAEAVTMHMQTIDSPLSPPGVQLRTKVMLVRTALQQDLFDKATEALDEAYALAGQHNLPLLELHALRAALAFMQLQPHQEHIDAALALNPAWGDAWAIPGYFATITRRYREAGEFYSQAVMVQPNHWEAHLELGQNHLRLNQVTPAQDHVRIAYAGDPFNPRAVNLLRLLDTFIENMVVLNYPDPPQGAFPRLSLRLDRKEADVLKHYARDLSERSIDIYSERYRFEPKAPVVVEIFPNHEDFVVRSIGMPGVGILGVTFGYLFAMDSPTAHPRGESYHWGTTLWHEMAHVFTLEITGNLVPRWFSEGISVFEEWRTGPIPGRKIPNNVFKAMADGKFLPIAKLDDGFMRPTYEDQVIVSYMQAGLVFEFIDIEYGFDKIVDMLYMFKDGTKPVTAIEQVLGISAADFDKHFEQFINIEYGNFLGRIPVWQQDQRDSFAALEREDWAEAIAAAERANFIYPDYVEPDAPYIAMARAYSRLEDKENEFRTLETFWKKGGYAPRALMALGSAYKERGENALALQVFNDVIWADPFMQAVHKELGDLYLAQGETDKALREYQVLLALNPIDKASANLNIALAHRALDDNDKAMEYLMTALDIAPQYRPAQLLLLEMTRNQANTNNQNPAN